MNRPALALLALALAPALFGAGQKGPISYDDRKGTNLKWYEGYMDNLGGGRFQFDLSGGVTGASESQGVRFAAERAKGGLAPDPGRKGATRLTALQLTGGVRIVRTQTKGGATSTTVSTAKTATYEVGAGDSAEVTMRGDVTIVDAGGGGTTTLTGENGRAALSTAAGTKTPLKNATMTGGVRIKAVQRNAAGALATYNATGDRLDYVANGDGTATVTMTGNLKFDSPDAEGGGGTITGATKAVLTLSPAGEVTRVRLSSDGAAPVRTTFKTGKKG